LNKDVKWTFDDKGITSTQNHVQCHSGTISILLDPTMKTRHLIYFRQICDDKPGKFVEWPGTVLFRPQYLQPSIFRTQLLITVVPSVSSFKDPKEPRKSKVTIESLDGRFLPLPRCIIRRGTESSITTIQSNESAKEAFSRMEKTNGIKGLVIEFYSQPGMSLASFYFFSHLFPYLLPHTRRPTF